VEAAAAQPPETYYRPPAGARQTLVRTDRPRRISRYHRGAHVGDGPLLVPEACNLDQAFKLTDLGDIQLPADAFRTGAACRRCFPR
jgi:hypothetical protein